AGGRLRRKIAGEVGVGGRMRRSYDHPRRQKAVINRPQQLEGCPSEASVHATEFIVRFPLKRADVSERHPYRGVRSYANRQSDSLHRPPLQGVTRAKMVAASR